LRAHQAQPSPALRVRIGTRVERREPRAAVLDHDLALGEGDPHSGDLLLEAQLDHAAGVAGQRRTPGRTALDQHVDAVGDAVLRQVPEAQRGRLRRRHGPGW